MAVDDQERFNRNTEEFFLAQENFHQGMRQFILTELEAGITFASVALGSSTEDKRQRNRTSARRAYDSAIRFWKRYPLLERAAQQELFARKGELEHMLVQLGESLEKS